MSTDSSHVVYVHDALSKTSSDLQRSTVAKDRTLSVVYFSIKNYSVLYLVNNLSLHPCSKIYSDELIHVSRPTGAALSSHGLYSSSHTSGFARKSSTVG